MNQSSIRSMLQPVVALLEDPSSKENASIEASGYTELVLPNDINIDTMKPVLSNMLKLHVGRKLVQDKNKIYVYDNDHYEECIMKALK
jgi:hypothetical protein